MNFGFSSRGFSDDVVQVHGGSSARVSHSNDHVLPPIRQPIAAHCDGQGRSAEPILLLDIHVLWRYHRDGLVPAEHLILRVLRVNFLSVQKVHGIEIPVDVAAGPQVQRIGHFIPHVGPLVLIAHPRMREGKL
eukprot:752322-Hanusia_phi.AAC.3